MKVELKGIVRGTFSKYQTFTLEDAPVMVFTGSTLEEVVTGLALEEWMFVLRVNGIRIKDAFSYLERKGLPRSDYMREAA